MTSPSSSSATSNVADSGVKNIDSLLSGYKWGGGIGLAANISYSFPWINGLSAVFAGPNGNSYSSNNEQTAAQHFGLNSNQQTAAIAALATWSNVANINFQRVTETDTNVGDIRFAFSSASSLDNWWGYASFPSSYWSKGGDIWINAKYGSATDWTVGTYNFSALMHEIGHALGLEHPFAGNITLSSEFDSTQFTLMSYTKGPYTLYGQVITNANGTHTWVTRNISPETPMLLDIAVMQYMYGANNTYKTGDDSYTFDPKTPFLKTIWDAGGNDTISVANFGLGCEINLTPGTFSKISIPSDSPSAYNWSTPPTAATYDGTNNLSIAYNCIIENAIGGSGNDKLTGNTANNSLDGGAGNDIMYGGDGNDTFDWDSTKRSGNDTFYGGRGNDVFVLDNSNDQVVEFANEGTDTVWVNFSFSLSSLPNVENLYCFGASSFNISGNSANNFLEGSTGDDTIDGGAGADTVFFNDKLADCSITASGLTYVIKTKTQGTDTVRNVELLSFLDQTLDLSKFNLPINVIGTANNDSLAGSVASENFDGLGGIDTVVVNRAITNYLITKTTNGYSLSDKTGVDGFDTLVNIEAIKFLDKTVNLTVQAKAASAPQADVTRLAELYTAFFNRVPDADGMSFWLDQIKGGMTVNQVAAAFYNAGVSYSTLTGFSASMTNADFINVIYRNVLGRKDGADAGGLLFWSNELSSGRANRGTLVTNILDSAHTFKGNATWGWVANLLDNKITVAKKFSIDMGLNYNTPEESITKGMAIASAITPTDMSAAIALIGVPEANLQLS